MQLLDNWRDVLTKAWSVRPVGLGLAAEIILEYLGADLPSWAVISLLVAIFGSRFVAQSGLSKTEGGEPDYGSAS